MPDLGSSDLWSSIIILLRRVRKCFVNEVDIGLSYNPNTHTDFRLLTKQHLRDPGFRKEKVVRRVWVILYKDSVLYKPSQRQILAKSVLSFTRSFGIEVAVLRCKSD